MKRREFITLLGGAAAAWPLAARAQQPAMPVIGFLNGASPDGYAPMVAAFRQGLKEAGYCRGPERRDRISLGGGTIRPAAGDGGRSGSPSGGGDRRDAARRGSGGKGGDHATIPIVFTTGSDPVQIGLVASLSRPGGNVTGVTQLNVAVAPKRLELLHELVPTATIIALLVNPTNPLLPRPTSKDLQAAARTSGCSSMSCDASTERDFDAAFATLAPTASRRARDQHRCILH